MSAVAAVLHVCTTCRAGTEPAPHRPVPGALLHRAVLDRARRPEAVREVACLAACGRGCTAVLVAPGKWSMLLGGLGADHAADLLDLLDSYDASPNGTVLPSRRAPSLRNAMIGRIPG